MPSYICLDFMKFSIRKYLPNFIFDPIASYVKLFFPYLILFSYESCQLYNYIKLQNYSVIHIHVRIYNCYLIYTYSQAMQLAKRFLGNMTTFRVCSMQIQSCSTLSSSAFSTQKHYKCNQLFNVLLNEYPSLNCICDSLC